MGSKRSKKKSGEQEEEEVDYAATADAFFGTHSDDDDEGPAEGEQDDGEADDSDAGEKGSEDISEQSESDDEDDDDDLSSDHNLMEVQDESEASDNKLPESAHGERCTFDLRNLLALNAHQVDASKLYSARNKKGGQDQNIAIPPDHLPVDVNENYLLQRASDGCTQLIAALWQLPVERSDAGPMVQLPHYDSSKIPRALPLPPPKKETKWEKFAKAKGIALNKNKRSRKVFDEATGTWMYRHGYQKANDDSKEWPIMEVKGNADPYEDPWERMREEKRARTDKNIESRMRNEERAGNLAKGTTTRVLKSRTKTRQTGKVAGNMDRDNVPPTGVPVDLRPTKVSGPIQSAKRGKASTLAALAAVQKSTASMGRFDKVVEGEPERKKILDGSKKRKYVSATDKTAIATEADRSMKLFKAAVEGGGAEKEKARKKGKLAKGETAYDYEYNDGLGPSSFRKKKGRAGAGKMKKMTKKRVK